MVEGNVVRGGELVEIAVIGNDGWNLHRQRADAKPVQQIVQAMPEARHHHEHALPDRDVADLPPHSEVGGRPGKPFAQRGDLQPAGIKAHAHEEAPGLRIAELRAFKDVAAVIEKERRDARHDAHAIGA
jgi:hypothetical protein